MYVPTLSQKIYQAGAAFGGNMSGYLVGNGVFDHAEALPTHAAFAALCAAAHARRGEERGTSASMSAIECRSSGASAGSASARRNSGALTAS